MHSTVTNPIMISSFTRLTKDLTLAAGASWTPLTQFKTHWMNKSGSWNTIREANTKILDLSVITAVIQHRPSVEQTTGDSITPAGRRACVA